MKNFSEQVQAVETRILAEQVRQLQGRITQLEQAVVSHAVIDQAFGVLVAVGRITPAEAGDVLRETSMCTNSKLRHVAELVVAWVSRVKIPDLCRGQGVWLI